MSAQSMLMFEVPSAAGAARRGGRRMQVRPHPLPASGLHEELELVRDDGGDDGPVQGLESVPWQAEQVPVEAPRPRVLTMHAPQPAIRLERTNVPGDRHFGWQGLRGRLVEVRTGGASAALSAVVEVIWQAQRAGEPAAWVHGGTPAVHVTDLRSYGVDPQALAVVRLWKEVDALRAAERLLRSGGFGVVVIDLIQGQSLGSAEAGRLARLAETHDAAVILLVQQGVSIAAGSLISLRAQVHRQRIADGRFERRIEIQRDKRTGSTAVESDEVEGPDGVR